MKWQCWPQPFCVEGATDSLAPCVDAPDEGLAGAGVRRSAGRFVWGSRAAGCLSGTKRQPSQSAQHDANPGELTWVWAPHFHGDQHTQWRAEKETETK